MGHPSRTRKVPTLEIRAMDVNADVDDTVALAVLMRAHGVDGGGAGASGDPDPRAVQ